jgi:3-hydroxyacyl-CoA dehydrogenase
MKNMAQTIRKVVVLGANGAMGAGSGEVFAAARIPTVFLARTRDKAEKGRARAEALAKSEAVSAFIRTGSYDADLEREVADADLVFEAVSEALDLKRVFFARIDRARRADTIVATVSSGLSIAAMCAGQSESFRKNFLGVHLFNPPNVIVGCEVIPHAETDAAGLAFVCDFLAAELGREVIKTADTPAFAGNRVGFKVLNEVAQLAAEHGVAALDTLLGPHTGRAMSPLTTIDFVGWDVHKAIVDNLHANTNDEAHAAFVLPEAMAALIAAGHLGQKTPAQGGFFKRVGKGKDAELYVLDLARRDYVPAAAVVAEPPALVTRMQREHRIGRYGRAFDILCEARGRDADLMRRFVLGYISYGLGRVGEVVEAARDIDRIMGFGFNWAPPGVLVDVIGARRTVTLLEQARLHVPPVVLDAAERNVQLFADPRVDVGRFFIA